VYSVFIKFMFLTLPLFFYFVKKIIVPQRIFFAPGVFGNMGMLGANGCPENGNFLNTTI